MGKFTDLLKKVGEERLGRIEKMDRRTQVKYEFVAKKTVESNIDPRIVTFYDPISPVTEQYRTLRTNLAALSTSAKPIKAITITSATHGEGKTISAINLAITVAREVNNKSVLLIDADMRRSKVNRYLGIPPHDGLAEMLGNGTDISEGLLNISGIPNLTVIQAGKHPHNPAELLGSARMKELMNKLKARFDFIILDAPPVVPVTDVGIFGSIMDGVLMVVQANRTQKGVVKHAVSLLKQAQTQLLGYVLTDIRYHIPAYIYRYL
jgi:capsular exopolysaccharide synthesis family protein